MSKLTDEEIEIALASSRRSAEVEGIQMDPQVDDLFRRQLKDELSGTEVRKMICELHADHYCIFP